jgi:V-type H+-transporting ATPase subunit E
MAAGSDVTKKQIEQMTQFILNEATEKSMEIVSKGEEESSISQHKAKEAGKERIRAEYIKKTKALETANAIAKSTAINKGRLDKIKSRQEALGRIHTEASAKLASESSGKKFLTDLIVQGMLMLLEDNVRVRCRAKDDATVQSCFADAQRQYSAVIQKESGASKNCTLSLDATNKLPAEMLGGVVLSCQNDSITVDNTVDSRLGLVMEQAKPKIRQLLFAGRK